MTVTSGADYNVLPSEQYDLGYERDDYIHRRLCRLCSDRRRQPSNRNPDGSHKGKAPL